ncbi:hypothetical protein PR048_002072 [Dryococelus australis]|uniref:Uncharacterized protein n=1 Tax=Dryococelus australis TaxID=614101 RepID=A0ABQ9IJ93_9NEOP|nr:hypothetical protein PR048_002072 [Dryococelus australis]
MTVEEIIDIVTYKDSNNSSASECENERESNICSWRQPFVLRKFAVSTHGTANCFVSMRERSVVLAKEWSVECRLPGGEWKQNAGIG